jgi:hypothetical protein
VAQPSLAAWALGMAPYKDAWYSSSQESQQRNDPDTGYWRWHEPYPRTHALVASLSGGPVLFGDGVNASNRSLILQTCRADGLLLKPDRPATPTDEWWMSTLTDPVAALCKGDFSVTHTTIPVSADDAASAFTWLYALGVQLCVPYSLGLREWLGAVAPFRKHGRAMVETQTPHASVNDSGLMLIFRVADPASTLREASSVDNVTAVLRAGSDYGSADFWAAAPVLHDTWALLGELSKFVVVSHQRIARILMVNSSCLQVSLMGSPGEVVALTAAHRWSPSAGWKLTSAKAAITASGTADCWLMAGQML